MSASARRFKDVVGPRGAVTLSLLLAGSSACSFLVETRSQQCQVDADCEQFNDGNAHCDQAQHVCVAGPPCDDKGGTCVCNPQTNDDLLNACTDAPCTPFDDARLTKLVNGALPPLPNTMRSFVPSIFDAGTVGTTCDSLPGRKVYVIGPASVKPFLTVIGKHLKQQGILVVFQQTTSCDSVTAMINLQTTLITKSGAVYFNGSDTDGQGIACDIVATGGKLPKPDIASSETFAASCSGNFTKFPGGVTDEQGPVVALSFVAPSASKQTVMSAEAAYFIYGFGSKSGVSPWTDETFIYERDPSSGTQNVIAQTIGVPAKVWLGQRTTGTGDEIDKLEAITAAAQANKTIGEMAANEAENERGNGLTQLAYQHTNQVCAYYPDTTADATDKQNVRDGHYALWGPLHLIHSDSRNADDARTVINLITGVSIDESIDLVAAAATAHVVPQCAMHVQRVQGDGTPMTPFQPDISCSCYYDKLTIGQSTCTPCTTSLNCANVKDAPNCHFGFCEP